MILLCKPGLIHKNFLYRDEPKKDMYFLKMVAYKYA